MGPQGPQNQLHRCSCCNPLHANCICIISSIVLIMIVFITSSSCAIYTSINLPEADRMQHLHILYYFAYLFLPMLICIPLIYIVKNLKDHCGNEEFIIIAEDQWPPDVRRRWRQQEQQQQQQGQWRRLIELLENLAKPKKRIRCNPNPCMMAHCLENLNAALEFIKKEKILLVNIGERRRASSW